MHNINNVFDVVKWRLCLGCGACYYICNNSNIVLKNILDDGIRPFDSGKCSNCLSCVNVCPGINTSHIDPEINVISELATGFGPILEIWEGYAENEELRYKASSGGIATAIALYCLHHESVSGVLHTVSDPDNPSKNKTRFSTTEIELLESTGSRYSPASPCDGFKKIEIGGDKSVFIGKPCDIAACKKVQEAVPEFKRKLFMSIGIFCAGTPSTRGTLDWINKFGIKISEIKELRYRGHGWPGNASIKKKQSDKPSYNMTYENTWGFLQKYRPYRCHLCPDGTSELADLACGDPWYRKIEKDELGSSLVLVRSQKGKEILNKAMEAKYIRLKKVNPNVLVKSQVNLLHKRREIWGRLLAFRLMGLPYPKFKGFQLFQNWREQTTIEKSKSVLGTIRRIITRKYYKAYFHDQNIK